MSGHSHWSKIKHKKKKKDKKKGKIFSKLSQNITTTVREDGDNPKTNPKLKQYIEEAKKNDMPKENIERAIKKGTGDLEGQSYEKITLEFFGPEETAFILEGTTDNKNRTRNEIYQILKEYEGKMAEPGSVKWRFERKGEIVVEKQDEEENLELKAIESGAEDTSWKNDKLYIQTPPKKLDEIKNNLKQKGMELESSQLIWNPKKEKEVENNTKEKIKSLLEEISDNDDVEEVFCNVKI